MSGIEHEFKFFVSEARQLVVYADTTAFNYHQYLPPKKTLELPYEDEKGLCYA